MSDLGTTRLSWRRLGVLLRQLPSTARTAQSEHGEAYAWNQDTHLLAAIVDLLAGANWQRSGAQGVKPTPIQRPGQPKSPGDARRIGTPLPREEVRYILDHWSDN